VLLKHEFDWARGDTMRLVLLSLSPREHYLVFCLNLMIMDGISMQVFIDELQNCYNSNNLMREPPQFSEYSEKQHADAATGKYETEIGFWKTELSSISPPLPMLSLSKVASRPTKKVCGNERAILVFSKERKARVPQFCRRCRATPFHFYLTILRVLILRYVPSALDRSCN
jgi:hybrid polyketide synthase / nonribosomal peptide synthetase ACE1